MMAILFLFLDQDEMTNLYRVSRISFEITLLSDENVL